MKRTNTCNELTASDNGKEVMLIGWVQSVRDHGGILFIDLRDREGITQVVFHPEATNVYEKAQKLKDESVIQIFGKVALREEGTKNASLKTGDIEVVANDMIIHNICEPLPFPLEDERADKVNEDLRLQYRYLDLRRPRNLNLLRMRHKAAQAIRDYLNSENFIEVETPILFKSTPEGAREFLVPSRTNPGMFYALNQSPQQYKQMLMVSGIERYYQMAKCFRDEDLRADRQPEFTQVDIELSFVEREDMYALIENMLKKIWKDTLGMDIPTPFPRMQYVDAMNRYGVDKPDTRFGIELQDLTDVFKDSQFKVFASVVANGGVIKAINAKGLSDITQGELKSLEDVAKTLGAKGLAFIKAENGAWKSPILKFLSEAEQTALKEKLNIEDGDIVFFAASNWEQACAILGRVRLDCGKLLQARGKIVIDPKQFNFLWVIEFPLMLWDEEQGRYVSAHHPFTSPVPEDVQYLETDPLKVRGQHYDIVLNGTELGGGSIRIHQPDVQEKVFKDVLKIPADVVESRFGYRIKAIKDGAPPDGGSGFGFDRLVTILTNRQSIRDIIAFPKTQKGQDLMAQSPSPVVEKQLKDLHIALDMPESE